MTMIAEQIACELSITAQQVNATIKLLDQGDTVPFIARYRKEVTRGLDDIQLRKFAERLVYLRDLQQRRETILQTIEQQGLLTQALTTAINSAVTKTLLEDLYLPFKPKRNSKASAAKAAGLQPLADQLCADTSVNPEYIANAFINKKLGILTTAQALAGAQQIIIESLAENSPLLAELRQWLTSNGQLIVKVKRGKKDLQSNFRDYFDYSEAVNKVPSHRILAIYRGVKASVLKLKITAQNHNSSHPLKRTEQYLIPNRERRSQDYWLKGTAEEAWQTKLLPQLEADISKQLRESADTDSIKVFATNLTDLLMAAPAGQKVTLGLDPGLRSGVKVVVISGTGKLLAQAVIYPHAPQKQWQNALSHLKQLVEKYRVELVSIGNGTASRETEQLVTELQLLIVADLVCVVVSEAGASVYSASELASREFPDVDVSIRGAISIARRLQDPLAELVKIDPKAIGVGQYQHDVNQKSLLAKLATVTEDCVNKVGVNLNSASVQLLTQVAGINQRIAENIVEFRETTGEFRDRKCLLKVPRLGDKAFQQCAGFLRLQNPRQPLDNSAVHPESYPLVERMAASAELTSARLIGNQSAIDAIDAATFYAQYGQYTVTDTLIELAKPARDPRPKFKTATFDATVNSVSDLQLGMSLEGVITNVTNFGAFVDIGVHQDGLVHISQLADQFVKDPHQIVKTGQIVQVKVLEVDESRKRIALSMKSR